MLTFIALYAIKQPMQADTLATLDSSKYDSQLSAVSSTGRCNAILKRGGCCHESKNAHLLHARTKSDYLGQVQAR
ncbi:hypothetical protein XBKQ1_1150017 [Xenorhabdus bovienii str. kraussei Quebec]|uniref:Uncharacterized protein n=1 Tax=Xenorhabdus bovienii str. kraussei Quebec TaxID=1398203 RepID=A0A077P1T0_XENBV|nr:hypothetical protein XBKQ1_1150017 [Xenorhabdus bovienii str. kraussei Quebec]